MVLIVPAIKHDGSRRKVLLICVDGATWNIVDPMIREGRLPHFARLKKEGTTGILFSDVAYSPPCWTSLATGKVQEKHGVLDFFDAHKRRVPYVWEILEPYGIRTAVVSWLMMLPCDMRGPAFVWPWFQKDQGTFIPEKIGEKLEKKEKLPVPPPFKGGEIYRFFEIFDKNTSRIASYFVQNFRPSFLAVGFHGSNPFQHRYWSAYDPAYFHITSSEIHEKKDWVPGYYEKIDIFLADYMRKGFTIVFVSDHGFCRNDRFSGPRIVPNFRIASDMRHINFLMNVFLEKLGYLQFIPKPEFGGQIDLSRTRAYFFNHRLSGEPGVKLNRDLLGSQGVAMALREISDLLSGARFETGDKVFEDVRINPSAPGEYEADVVFRLSPLLNKEGIVFRDDPSRPDKMALDYVKDGDTRIKEIVVGHLTFDLADFVNYSRNGVHEHEGMMILWGRPFKKGIVIRGANLYDITPTLLYLYGRPVGRDMDGRILLEAMESRFVKKRSPSYIDSHDARFRPDCLRSQEQEPDMERLHSLGYAH